MKKALFLIAALVLVVGLTLIPATSASAAITNSLTIIKYHDLNGNGADDGEPRLPGWVFWVDGPAGFTDLFVTTEGDGTITLNSVPPGEYTITETLKDGWTNTDPGLGILYKTITVTEAAIDFPVKFGNSSPVGGDVLPIDKAGVLAPWLGLALLLIGGMGWLALRRRRALS